MNDEQTEQPQNESEPQTSGGTGQSQPRSSYVIAGAIVFAGALVAAAIIMTADRGASAQATAPAQGQQQQEQPTTDKVRAVTQDDHIKGSIDAPVKIVEYSDFECPFCKRFHGTMNQIMDEYGESGEVAWIFRHFPLEQLHPVKAKAAAVASECAAEQGGNDAFWAFTDTYFERTLTNNRTDIETVIPAIARDIGLDEAAFKTCRESGKYDEKIQKDIENAVESGGRGTPWSVVIGPDGETYPINGAQPYDSVERLINIAKQ